MLTKNNKNLKDSQNLKKSRKSKDNKNSKGPKSPKVSKTKVKQSEKTKNSEVEKTEEIETIDVKVEDVKSIEVINDSKSLHIVENRKTKRHVFLSRFQRRKRFLSSLTNFVHFFKPKRYQNTKTVDDFVALKLLNQLSGYSPRKDTHFNLTKKRAFTNKSRKMFMKSMSLYFLKVHDYVRLKSKNSFLKILSTFDANPIKYLNCPLRWKNRVKIAKSLLFTYLKTRDNFFNKTDDVNNFSELKIIPKRTGLWECQELLDEKTRVNLPYHFVFNFRITSNNIFCHLTDSFGETVFPLRSSSFYKYKISNVNLRHFIETVLTAYYKSVQEFLEQREMFFPSQVIFRIFSAKKHRRKLITCIRKVYLENMVTQAFRTTDKQLLAGFGYSNLEDMPKNMYPTSPGYWFEIPNQKPFNGCRVRKLKRKKRFRVRKFKLYR